MQIKRSTFRLTSMPDCRQQRCPYKMYLHKSSKWRVASLPRKGQQLSAPYL